MDRARIVESLDAAERSVVEGRGLKGTGFWRVVDAARADAALAAEFGPRIGAIDTRAFEQRVRARVPAAVGTAALAGATVVGVAGIAAAPSVESRLLKTLVFLGAFGALEVSTHSLTHWLVGRMMGMRFTHYFLGGPPPPRPGAKTDYATYLRVPPRQRAVMHGSGAVVTKILPFAMIPLADDLDLEPWTVWLLLGVGVGQIVTDVLFSTKNSDWRKVKRELDAARRWRAAG